MAIPCVSETMVPRDVHKSVEVFVDIDRIEEQAFAPSHVGVFDQNAFGAIEAPHLKSRPKESAVGVKLVQPRHRVETIDRDPVLSGEAVIGLITDSSAIE